MAILDIEGDFTAGFANFIATLRTADTAGLRPDELQFSETMQNPTRLFGASFEGTISQAAATGTIDTVDASLTTVIPGRITKTYDFTFTGLDTVFESVFTISGGFFSYSERQLLLSFDGRDYTVTGSDADDKIGRSTQFSFGGNDAIDAGKGKDIVKSGAGADMLKGGAARDKLYGENGNDTLAGQGGRDVLVGGRGQDVLQGGAGNDRLVGGAQKDTLTGGKGADVFVFGTDGKTDRVLDFRIGVDRIETQAATGIADLKIKTVTAGALVTDGTTKMLLAGIDGDDLGAADFLF